MEFKNLRENIYIQILKTMKRLKNNFAKSSGNFTLTKYKNIAIEFESASSPHSGMLSCFFQGFSSFLFRNIESALESRRRVALAFICIVLQPRYRNGLKYINFTYILLLRIDLIAKTLLCNHRPICI